MKLLLNIMIAGLCTLFFTGCYAELGDESEQHLVIDLDPGQGSGITRTFGTTYDFKVLVKSILPPRGVDVSIVYRQDSDNAIVFSQAYYITATSLPVVVTNIPFNEVGTVTVTAISKSDLNNTETKTFKLVRK